MKPPVCELDAQVFDALANAAYFHAEKVKQDDRLNATVKAQRYATDQARAALEKLTALVKPQVINPGGLGYGEVLAAGPSGYGFVNAGGKLQAVRLVDPFTLSGRLTETPAAKPEEYRSDRDRATNGKAETKPETLRSKMDPIDSARPLTPYELRTLRGFLHTTLDNEERGYCTTFIRRDSADALARLIDRETKAKPEAAKVSAASQEEAVSVFNNGEHF